MSPYHEKALRTKNYTKKQGQNEKARIRLEAEKRINLKQAEPASNASTNVTKYRDHADPFALRDINVQRGFPKSRNSSGS
jgi:hypothetical protein